MSCRKAYRQQRGQAFVVTYRGTVRGGPPARWRRRPAEDVVFRRSPPEEGVVFDVDIIIDMLGREGHRQLRTRERRLGVSGALRARWVATGPSGGGVLQVRVGPYPLAELIDQNGDGRVESMLFQTRR